MTYNAHCTCGWSFDREKDAANLPEENNREIADTVVSCHQFAHEFEENDYEATRDWGGVKEANE